MLRLYIPGMYNVGPTTLPLLHLWSPGGWLAGAALNQRPDLFSATVLTVASLDVVTTFHTDPCPGDSAELGDARGDLTVRREVLAWSPADNLPDPQVCTPCRLWHAKTVS
jgi:protease II